jgi:type III secretion protein T
VNLEIETLLRPHIVSVTMLACRLFPVAFLCPIFGGQQAPMNVKLSVVLALSCFLHWACGISVMIPQDNTFDLVALALKETLFGTTLGFLASLPFDAARMGGRFIDLFRGSSAEAALPLAGSKEAASGDLMYQVLMSTVASGALMPLMISALLKSFALVPVGTAMHSDTLSLQAVALFTGALSTALAIGAPIAAASVGVDAMLGLASRAAPNMNLQEVGSPIRILGGGALLWLGIAVFSTRLQDFALEAVDSIRSAGLG